MNRNTLDSFREHQREIDELRYVEYGDKQIPVSDFENQTVSKDMLSKMRMNSYARDALPPKLTDQALVETVEYYLTQIGSPRFPCTTYD